MSPLAPHLFSCQSPGFAARAYLCHFLWSSHVLSFLVPRYGLCFHVGSSLVSISLKLLSLPEPKFAKVTGLPSMLSSLHSEVQFSAAFTLRLSPQVQESVRGRTRARLCQNATLAVAEEILGADGRVYLRLADGRGWAFDDSALFPHDPSVVCLGFRTLD